METRKITNQIIDLADEEIISYRDLALMALKWMSEDDIADMLKANDIIIDEEDY